MADTLKEVKGSRSEKKRLLKVHVTKVKRVSSGEVQEETPLGDLLLELDALFDAFGEEHETMLQVLGELEDGQAAIQGKVSNKTMEEYATEVEELYNEASGILLTKIKVSKDLDDAKKQRMQTFITGRDMDIAIHALEGELGKIGSEILSHPETLRNMDPQAIEEIRVRMHTVSTHSLDLQRQTEALVALNLTGSEDLIKQAQTSISDARRQIEGMESELKVMSRVTGRPTLSSLPTAGSVHAFQPATVSTPQRGVATSPLGLNRRTSGNMIAPSPHVSGYSTGSAPTTKSFKFKPMEFPVFNGKRREWPHFKSVWKHVVEVQGFSNFYLAQQLWTCVKNGTAADLIKAVTIRDNTSYNLMWSRLEEFYGDQGAVLQALYHELDSLRSIKTDVAKEVIRFVNDLECIHESLFSISSEHPKKVNVNQVDRLTLLLPEDVSKLWNRYYHKLDQETKESPFTEFVTFMVQERACRMRFLDTKPEYRSGRSANSHAAETQHEERHPRKEEQKNDRPAMCWLDTSHKGHFTRNCKLWRALSPKEKRHTCLEKRKCLVCLDPFKRDHKCVMPTHVIDKIICKKGCKARHRTDVACGSVEANGDDLTEEVQTGCVQTNTAYTARYAVQVRGVSDTVPLFADDGSDVSFVYDKRAQKSKFKEVGKKTLQIKTLNGTKKVPSILYEVPIVTDEQVEKVICHSVPHLITGKVSKSDLSKLKMLFPKYKGIEQLQRDTRPAEILLGLDYFKLHPQRRVYSAGNLSIMRGRLGDTLVGSDVEREHGVNATTVSNYYINKEKDATWKKFIQGEDVGTLVNPICGGCKCGKCPQIGATYSFKEESELRLIREGLSFNEEQQRWICECPWIKPPEDLPDNRHVALATLYSTEKTLAKDPEWHKIYSEQISELESRGYCRKLSRMECKEWKGPKFYICHLAVQNPKSITTPVRIVFNSSQTCKGVSLNDCLAKGPDNYLNCLLAILIRWREYPGVLLADISKMFYAVGMKLKDQHCHRFLWREKPGEEPNTYVMTALNMGDVCSPAIALESLFQTGEKVQDSKPEVSFILKESSYMDDLIHSTLSDPVLIARDVYKVLKEHGFKVKQWQFTGESGERDEDTLFQKEPFETPNKLLKGKDGMVKVLGLNWSPVDDKILHTTEINFSPKKKGIRLEPDLLANEFVKRVPLILTRRTVLEQVGKIFDPLGLIGPHVLKAKILLRKTWEPNLGWDDELPTELYNEWIAWFQSCFELNDLEFKRCTRPDQLEQQDPMLVILSDGSSLASGYTAYVRWCVSPNKYQSFLLMAKNRIAPRKVISIPKLELNGAVLGVRGRKTVLKACRYQFSKIIHLVDSETVLCQINAIATRFKVYEGTRVGEIQTTCGGDMSSWYWVPGELNVADLNTRGRSPVELGPGSIWQNGPEFLQNPIEEWPVKSISEIRKNPPNMEVSVCAIKTEEVKLVQFGRVSKWETLVRSIARVIVCCRARSFHVHKQEDVSTQVLKEARILILKEVQTELQNIQQNYKNLGIVLTEEGLWAVGGRGSIDNNDLPVLMPNKHPAATLVMEKAHRDTKHAGRDTTLAKCRQQYYMAHGSKKAKAIRNRCTLCRLIDKRALTQKMGMVPLVSLKPAPAFNVVQLDLFGPWMARGEIQKRTTGKVWGVLFVCMASRAVHIEIIAGYSTQDFIMGLERFSALRGWPHKIHSDPGSQLVAADKELKSAWQEMDLIDIQRKCTNKGTDWQFSPADSPHYQGLTEALIKTVKRAVKAMYSQNKRLSWQEYSTVGHQIADLVNSRPLGKMGEVGDVIQVLTPNALILGRNSSDNPGCWPENKSMPRLAEVSAYIDIFWKKWTEIMKPVLTLEKKWNSQVRDLKKDDIVLVLESSPELGSRDYRLAKVMEVEPGKDGRVRSAKVMYKNFSSGKKGVAKHSGETSTVISRCCQRLVLIVPVEELTTHQNDYAIEE